MKMKVEVGNIKDTKYFIKQRSHLETNIKALKYGWSWTLKHVIKMTKCWIDK